MVGVLVFDGGRDTGSRRATNNWRQDGLLLVCLYLCWGETGSVKVNTMPPTRLREEAQAHGQTLYERARGMASLAGLVLLERRRREGGICLIASIFS